MGVITSRDDGESNDCERMCTLGDGVRGGGTVMVAMIKRSMGVVPSVLRDGIKKVKAVDPT